jgi:thermitase
MDRRGILLGSALSAAAVALPGRPAAARPSLGDYPEHRTAARLEADRAYAARQVAALSAADDRLLDRLRARQDGAPAGLRFYRHRSAGTGTEVLVARERAAGGGLDVVVPLGYVIKAQDYPWRTEGPPAAPAVARAAVRVALVDTGLAAKPRTDGWLDGVPIGPANTDPLDVLAPAGRLDWGAGHGTFTAGIVRRVAPQCEIVAYRFTRGDGLGTDQDVAALLLRAAAEGHQAGVPTIINASLGTPGIDGAPPAAMRAAIELISARYPDVLVVAAAGNMGTAEPVYPAAFDTVVAVGALTDDLRPAPFSSHGPWLTCSTVGVGVVSTFVPGVSPPEPDPGHPDQVFGPDAWAMWTGTSFSAPQVSGAVARLCAENPGVTARAALDLLLADRPKLPGYGKVLRLLPGTPT